jgi:non-ribosomal peptide synthetase component E (peptide arylation enzyme)
MILGERTPAGNDSPTLDNLFRRAAARRPDAVALIDPPNRADFTDGPPRRLRYGEADDAVSGLAARLRRLALPSDSVIGIALPNKSKAC